MTREDKEKFLEGKLPALPSNERQRNAVAYVNLVYSGVNKQKAFKTVFPERAAKAEERAKNSKYSASLALASDITNYESGKYVQELYKLTQETYWTMFIDKRTQLLNRLADKAMNDDLDERDQMQAAKIFLSHVPEVQKEEKVVHEVKLAEDTKFIEQLMAKKKQLYSVANDEDIIDVEVQSEL